MKKQPKATNSIWDVTKSMEPGVALELEGYGVTSFDPAAVQINKGEKNKLFHSTVGGYTSIYLTPADVKKLRAALNK
jgi:hypothetical protein